MASRDTLTGIIHTRALAIPEREAFRFLAGRHEEQDRLSYAQLWAEAQALAESLRERVPADARVPLVFAPGLTFIVALLACWMLRATAVPLAPESFRRDPLDRFGLLRRLGAPCVLSDVGTIALAAGGSPIPWLDVSRRRGIACDATAKPPESDPRDVALLQFTSGSTSAPRGVELTHGNLIANMEMIRRSFGHDGDSVVAAWAPLYHDQGLIGNVLQPLHLGSRCVLFSPKTFVRDPLLWLQIVSDHRVHTSGGPNFAYDLCVGRFSPAKLSGVDLSSWRVAFNGAEPVQAETLSRFAECFAPFGFDRRSMFPCYGLAEATLLASGGPARRAPVEKRVAGSARIGCGRVPEGTSIRIVDPDSGAACRAHEVGEIWISGPHVARGYWGDQAATRAHFGDYLRTGDLGFLDEAGELFPTGRLKDLIIQHGRNHTPEDVERTIAAASDDLDPYRGVVFSLDPGGREEVVAVHEIRRTSRRNAPVAEIVRAIRRDVSAAHGLTLHRVILVSNNTIELTTSGKKRRAQVRADYLAGKLPALEPHDALA